MPQQSFKSHAMFDPIWHFVISPITLLLVIATITHAIMKPDVTNIELVFFAVALLLTAFKERNFALKNQDRIIRLEEQIRLHRLMPGEASVIDRLSIGQLIGLRFASDAEAPALARRAAAEGLDRRTIKSAITTWRPDEHRV